MVTVSINILSERQLLERRVRLIHRNSSMTHRRCDTKKRRNVTMTFDCERNRGCDNVNANGVNGGRKTFVSLQLRGRTGT